MDKTIVEYFKRINEKASIADLFTANGYETFGGLSEKHTIAENEARRKHLYEIFPEAHW
jgi:hypothetical protein